MNYGGRLYQTSWPTYEEAKTVESEVEIAVQVNGKVRATIKIAADISKEDAIAAGKAAVADQADRSDRQGNLCSRTSGKYRSEGLTAIAC